MVRYHVQLPGHGRQRNEFLLLCDSDHSWIVHESESDPSLNHEQFPLVGKKRVGIAREKCCEQKSGTRLRRAEQLNRLKFASEAGFRKPNRDS